MFGIHYDHAMLRNISIEKTRKELENAGLEYQGPGK